MKKYNKKGISLIVLIITTIVMIILAAAIILSISNSGIMDKANQAKTDSDTANLKEYVNVLEAEWELGTKETSKEAYVNEKLKEKGYTSALLMEDGTLYTNLQANAKAALEAGIEVGDVVTGYTLDDSSAKKTYTTSGNENTAPSGTEVGPTKQTITRTDYVTWKYIGIGENGEILITPDMLSSSTDSQDMKVSGKGGYLNGSQELNDMCAAMYSTDKGNARSINLDDIKELLEYSSADGMYYDENGREKNINEVLTVKQILKLNGKDSIDNVFSPNDKDIYNYPSNGLRFVTSDTSDLRLSIVGFTGTSISTNLCAYWLASNVSNLRLDESRVDFGIQMVQPIGVYVLTFYSSDDSTNHEETLSLRVRPVVQLDSDVSVSYSNGTLTLN